MSSYNPPIHHPQAVYKVHIRRFDPDVADESWWQTVDVPWARTMTVVQALEWLWDQGNYVAFRANCREFTCGSCAMLINGKPGLACDTPLAPDMRLEPLSRYRVLRDLVVDTAPVREKWLELKPWPHLHPSGSDTPLGNVPRETFEAWHRSYARCIECYSCLEACPASASDTAPFAGPMWMLVMARAKAHPLDGQDRLQQAVEQGLGRCVSCYECATVCPVNISPVAEIQQLRRRVVVERLKAWGARLRLWPSRAVDDVPVREPR